MSDQLSLVYGALADATRRGIVERLTRGQCTVAELRRPLTTSAPAVSKHLRVLEAVGLIERRRAGRHQVCELRHEALAAGNRWFEEQLAFWSGTLDSLERHLARKRR